MKKLVILISISLLFTTLSCTIQTLEPTEEQIKADLLGQVLISYGEPVWTFAALSEYEEFDIKDTISQANALEYDVSMILHDYPCDCRFKADVLVVYKKIDGKWELISLVTKLFEQVSSGITH